MARGIALVALALAASALGPADAAVAGDAVRMTASFEPGARLGASTALNIGLHVDTRRVRSPVTAVRISYARGLGVVSSSLGLAPCRRPASDFETVLVTGTGLDGCPPNAVMAYGTARAEVRLLQSGQIIPEYATLSVLSGPLDNGRLQLVIWIDGQRPFGARIALAGEASDAPPPFGGALTVRFPEVEALQDLATIALTDLRLSIGSPKIRYRERGKRYRPEGIALPTRCPSGGFRFGLELEFRDGSRRRARTTATCPARPR